MNPWDADEEVGGNPWDADEEVMPGLVQRFKNAAAGMFNDISAGLQGVNPVALQETTGRAVGVLKDGYVDVDGTREPLENYPADRYVTRFEPSNGLTYIVSRSEKDSAGEGIEEGRAASAGRLLGYGLPSRAFAQAAPANALAQDAASVGVTPSFGMGGAGRSRLAAAGEQFPPTAGVFKRDAARVTEELGEAAGRLADRAGSGVTPVNAGEALQRGGETFVTGARGVQSKLYGAVDAAIPPSTGVSAPNTLAALAREGDKLRKLPNTITADRLKALEAGTMTWEQARALRTDIGTALRSFDGAETNVAKGQLDQIYAALSKDLDAVAAGAGPEAARAWKRANTFTRASEGRIKQAFGSILGEKVSPEAAYGRLVAMTSADGSRANIGALNKVFQSLPKEERAVVAGTIIRRLGRATAGAQDAAGEVFSPATFLSNWNNMSKEARLIVGRNGLDPGVGGELVKLARTIEAAKEAGKARNTSNTGSVIASLGLGSAFTVAPTTTVALSAISHLSARALTSREFLSAMNAYAAHGQAGPLLRLATGEGPLALEAATVLRLQSAETSRPLALPAPAPATR